MNYPIVLIHGFPLDSGMWDPQASALRAKGYQVLTPDLPGFGQAPPGNSLPSMESFAEDIHRLINLHGGKAVVGGLSMGGYVTLALLRDFPENVAAAMLFDTRADPDSAEARQNRLQSIEQMKADGPGKLIDTLLGKLLSKHARPPLTECLRGLMQRQRVETIIAAQQAMARRHDQTDLLAQLKIPLLLVVGAEDGITPPSVAMALHNHVPHSMLVQIAHAGHMSNLEQPERVTAAIETFLATVK